MSAIKPNYTRLLDFKHGRVDMTHGSGGRAMAQLIDTTLNEIVRLSAVGMMLHEDKLPIREQVKAACEFLGLDPLYVANEGKLAAICAPEDAERLPQAMRVHPLGGDAAVVGEVIEDPHHFVQMETAFGGRRVVDWLTGEQLPRIC